MNKHILFVVAIVAGGFFSSTPIAAQASDVSLQDNPNELSIAVTPVGYDDIGSVLTSMGWTFTEIQGDQLSDYEFLAQFDVIFINCPVDVYDTSSPVTDSLERFVREGGTLYASDWAFEYIDTTFPGYIHYLDDPFNGADQSVIADIVDPGLAGFLNSPTVEIEFLLDSWVTIESVSDAVTVYLAGDYRLMDGTSDNDKPLSVSFAYGEGRVVYTSFHNEGQTTEEENKLLSYLVLLTTTEKISAQLQENLAGSGYEVQEEILGPISAGETSPPHMFANQSITDLAVGLNWQAGTLRLSVFKPDGSLSAQQEGPPPLIIEIAGAEEGEWSYQVEALDVPYDNYPYVVQISVRAIVAATPTATSTEIVQATPTATSTEIVQVTPSAVADAAQGNNSPVLYVVIGLALLAGVAFIVMRRRKA